jgi:hypothetical protein
MSGARGVVGASYANSEWNTIEENTNNSHVMEVLYPIHGIHIFQMGSKYPGE